MKKMFTVQVLLLASVCLTTVSCKKNECECTIITAQNEKGGTGVTYIYANKSKARAACESRSKSADADGNRTECILNE